MKRWFWIAIAIPVLELALFETDVLPTGIFADNGKASYMTETIAILLTIGAIPLAIKIRHNHSVLAWISLMVAIVAALAAHYTTMNTSGLICSAMSLAVLIYCSPQKTKSDECNAESTGTE